MGHSDPKDDTFWRQNLSSSESLCPILRFLAWALLWVLFERLFASKRHSPSARGSGGGAFGDFKSPTGMPRGPKMAILRF